MVFIIAKMTSGTVSSLFLIFLSCTQVFAQTANTQNVQFNQVLNVNGDVSIPLSYLRSDLNLTRADATQLVPIPRSIKGRNLLSEAATDNC